MPATDISTFTSCDFAVPDELSFLVENECFKLRLIFYQCVNLQRQFLISCSDNHFQFALLPFSLLSHLAEERYDEYDTWLARRLLDGMWIQTKVKTPCWKDNVNDVLHINSSCMYYHPCWILTKFKQTSTETLQDPSASPTPDYHTEEPKATKERQRPVWRPAGSWIRNRGS